VITARAVTLTILTGAGAALAVRLPAVGPWTIALLAVGAGSALAIFSTTGPDRMAVPAGALAGVALVAIEPSWLAGAAFSGLAWIPRARRTASGWDAASVLVFACAGGAAAPILAGHPVPSMALQAAGALLAGVALAAPSLVPEATPECLALRAASRGLPAPTAAVLWRSALWVERILRSDATPALRERAQGVADALAEDGRALFRLGAMRGAGPLVDERRGDLVARVARLSSALERAWLTGEVPAPERRVRVARELEEETEATRRAHETLARMGYD